MSKKTKVPDPASTPDPELTQEDIDFWNGPTRSWDPDLPTRPPRSQAKPVQTAKGPLVIEEAAWDDPIYRRGFQVGVKKHTPIPQALVESEAVRLGFKILPPDHPIYKEPPSITMVSRQSVEPTPANFGKKTTNG